MINATQLHGSKVKENEYLDGWQRSRAELANLQKRLVGEQVQQRQKVTREITGELLTLADNFQVMTRHVPEELAENSWTTGVLHVARQLTQLLEEFGITLIEAKGQNFDPKFHEAVEQTSKTKLSTGSIVEVIQAGYQIGDEVVRPAKVKVAK